MIPEVGHLRLAFDKHASFEKAMPMIGTVRDRLNANGGCQRDLRPFADDVPFLMPVVALAAKENRGTASAVTRARMDNTHAFTG